MLKHWDITFLKIHIAAYLEKLEDLETLWSSFPWQQSELGTPI